MRGKVLSCLALHCRLKGEERVLVYLLYFLQTEDGYREYTYYLTLPTYI